MNTLTPKIKTPNWLLAGKCNKIINIEKRIVWDIKGCNPERYFGCQFCDLCIQKKCKVFPWSEWANPEDLEWEMELERNENREG